jgi:hypothetical protein
MDVNRIIGMIEHHRNTAYEEAKTDTTGCQQAVALDYEGLLAEIALQMQNHEGSFETE